MVIYIDNSIYLHGSLNTLSEEELLLFSDLASSHRHGNCLLCGDIHSIEYLIGILGGLFSDIYKKIRDRYSTAFSIINYVETVLVLTYSDTPTVPEIVKDKGRILKIPDALNCSHDYLCALVAENGDDCKFYRLIADRYIYDNTLKGVKCTFRNEPGGGSTINYQFQKCVKELQELTLCLVDSDVKHGPTKEYPNSPSMGGTAKCVKRTFANMRRSGIPSIYELYCSENIHEIENLIPLAVLDKIALSCPDTNGGVSLLKALKKHGLTEAILYYDFKGGKQQPKSEPERVYWQSISSNTNIEFFPPVCKDLLDKALNILEDCQYINSVPLDDYLAIYWNIIGKKVFTWGCSTQPIRA